MSLFPEFEKSRYVDIQKGDILLVDYESWATHIKSTKLGKVLSIVGNEPRKIMKGETDIEMITVVDEERKQFVLYVEPEDGIVNGQVALVDRRA